MRTITKILCSTALMMPLATAPLMAAGNGWNKGSKGWTYVENGSVLRNQWKKDGGSWYWLDENGIMATGWKKINGQWYKFDHAGVMQTQWKKENGQWFYLGYDGVMRTGQQTINGQTYYFYSDGHMASRTWAKTNGTYHFYGSTGEMACNKWIPTGGHYYYVDAQGNMLTNTWISSADGTERYWVDEDGVWTRTESKWKELLTNAVNALAKKRSHWKYALVDLNGNGVPEVIASGSCLTDGGMVLTVNKGSVVETNLTMNTGLNYFPGQNKILLSAIGVGHVGSSVCQWSQGDWTSIGSYGCYVMGQSTVYQVNGQEVSEAEYKRLSQAMFNESQSTYVEGKRSKSQILKDIQNW